MMRKVQLKRTKTQCISFFGNAVLERIYDSILKESGVKDRTIDEYSEKPVQILDHIMMRNKDGRMIEATFSEFIFNKTNQYRGRQDISNPKNAALKDYKEAMAKVE